VQNVTIDGADLMHSYQGLQAGDADGSWDGIE